MKVVHLARKPLSAGTVAKNVLEHGAGALNIDGARVSSPGEVISTHSQSHEAAHEKRKVFGKYEGDMETHQTAGQQLGRWPGNVILEHAEGCRFVGTKQDSGWGQHQNRPTGIVRQRDADGMENVAAWECAPGCPVAELDGQMPNAGAAAPVRGSEPSEAVTDEGVYGNRARVRGVFHGDKGGASRFFKQIRGE